MPEALATTKRKFHKLLDSRFGPAQATTTHAHAPTANPDTSSERVTIAEPAAKRIRSDASSSRTSTVPSHTHSASIRSIRPVASTSALRKQPTQLQPKNPPNFAPWSHDAFLNRLRSFTPVTRWHPKPDAVNEVEWAKRGWFCVDNNTVCCKGGCGERMLVDVEPVVRRSRMREEPKDAAEADVAEGAVGGEDDDIGDNDDDVDNPEDLEQALVDKYRDLIVGGHADGCLWRQAGCKDDIYRLPVVKSSVWQPELRLRYLSLMNMPNSFRAIRLKPDGIKPSPEKLLADFPPTLLAAPAPETATENADEPSNPSALPEDLLSVKPKALLIALCGWQGVTESGTDMFCCNACFQRIGLWMYQPDYKRPGMSSNANTDDHDDDHDGNMGKEEEEDDRSLDLIDLHREHCPWRNSVTQSATGEYKDLPAWKILHNVLTRYADEQRRRSRDHNVLARVVSGTETIIQESEHLVLGAEVGGEMPELTREETERLDKERTSRLMRLKKVLGFNKKRASVASSPG